MHRTAAKDNGGSGQNFQPKSQFLFKGYIWDLVLSGGCLVADSGEKAGRGDHSNRDGHTWHKKRR